MVRSRGFLEMNIKDIHGMIVIQPYFSGRRFGKIGVDILFFVKPKFE